MYSEWEAEKCRLIKELDALSRSQQELKQTALVSKESQDSAIKALLQLHETEIARLQRLHAQVGHTFLLMIECMCS